MLNAGLVERNRKKERKKKKERDEEGVGAAGVRLCVCAHAVVHSSASVPKGEGMPTFVGIVKAPQVSCAHWPPLSPS